MPDKKIMECPKVRRWPCRYIVGGPNMVYNVRVFAGKRSFLVWIRWTDNRAKAVAEWAGWQRMGVIAILEQKDG